MGDITAFLFLACVVTYSTGQRGFDFHDIGKNPQGNNALYCYNSTNQPVRVGQPYRLVCHICICGPYGRPISCSDNLCNQERIRTVSGTSVNQPANLHGPVKIPNKASVPSKIPLHPHMVLKTPPLAPILPKPPREGLAAKSPAKLFKHVKPSITAVAAAKDKPSKRSKYA